MPPRGPKALRVLRVNNDVLIGLVSVDLESGLTARLEPSGAAVARYGCPSSADGVNPCLAHKPGSLLYFYQGRRTR